MRKPNTITKKAILDARAGKTFKASSLKKLFIDLNKKAS
jgi:hypothetical protein